jgi:hypothetical protein
MVKAHRAYRHAWHVPPKEITERDYQGMCNFAEEGISFEAIATHFGCSIAHIEENIVLTENYGYLRKTSNNMESGKSCSDALKTFQAVIRRLDNRSPLTWKEYLDSVDWDEAYEKWGSDAVEKVEEKAKEIAARSNIELTFTDSSL